MLEDRQPVHPRHPHVEQHDVRSGLTDERDDRLARVDTPDDADVVLPLELDPNRLQHQSMIVDHEYLQAPHRRTLP